MKTTFTKLLFILAALLSAAYALPVRAQDQLILLYGSEQRTNTTPVQAARDFQLEYMHDLKNVVGVDKAFSYSLDYGNQGHFNEGIEHHRDYFGANFWAHQDFFDNRLRLGFGVGPVYLLDTTGGPAGFATQDVHNFGMSYTVAATLYQFQPLLLQTRVNLIRGGAFNTSSVMFGVGYELDGVTASRFENHHGLEQPNGFADTKNEVTIYGGKSIINVSQTSHTSAYSTEYRRDLTDNVQISAGYINEGKSLLVERRGINGEVWTTKSFDDDRLQLGAGGGLYIARDKMRPGASVFATPLVSVTVAYQVSTRFDVRAIWHRVITNYNRDADIYQVGLGYRF